MSLLHQMPLSPGTFEEWRGIALDRNDQLIVQRRAVEASRRSVEAGVRTDVDVLTATQQLYQAKRNLARARYQYMIASLQLKHAAGILSEQDLFEQSKWFTPGSAATPVAAKPGAVPVLISAH